jgi:hypothetical protein
MDNNAAQRITSLKQRIRYLRGLETQKKMELQKKIDELESLRKMVVKNNLRAEISRLGDYQAIIQEINFRTANVASIVVALKRQSPTRRLS